MAGQSKNLNLGGLVITEKRLAEIFQNMNGVTFTIASPSGTLCFNIRSRKEKFGCLPEILSLILQSLKAGNISVSVDLS